MCSGPLAPHFISQRWRRSVQCMPHLYIKPCAYDLCIVNFPLKAQVSALIQQLFHLNTALGTFGPLPCKTSRGLNFY